MNNSSSTSGIVNSEGPLSNRKPAARTSPAFPPNTELASNTETSYPLLAASAAEASPATPEPMDSN